MHKKNIDDLPVAFFLLSSFLSFLLAFEFSKTEACFRSSSVIKWTGLFFISYNKGHAFSRKDKDSNKRYIQEYLSHLAISEYTNLTWCFSRPTHEEVFSPLSVSDHTVNCDGVPWIYTKLHQLHTQTLSSFFACLLKLYFRWEEMVTENRKTIKLCSKIQCSILTNEILYLFSFLFHHIRKQISTAA